MSLVYVKVSEQEYTEKPEKGESKNLYTSFTYSLQVLKASLYGNRVTPKNLRLRLHYEEAAIYLKGRDKNIKIWLISEKTSFRELP